MAKLGEAFVDIKGNLQPLRASFKKAYAITLQSMKVINRSVIRIGQRMKGALVASAIGVTGLSAAIVKLAMDAEESENLFQVSVGNMAKETRKWSKELAKALGLNAYSIRENVATFNVMLKSMGLTEEKAVDMSKKMTKLAYDMASFYNLRHEEAFEKIQAGITGETEPLKRLGIIINETTAKTWALNNGLVEEGEQLTEVQKILARYGVLMDSTKLAQGDLRRTSNSLTNVLRSLKATLTELGIEIGEMLLPSVNKAAKAMKKWLTENKEEIKDWAKVFYDKTGEMLGGLKTMIQYMRKDFSKGFELAFQSVLILAKAMFESLVVMAKGPGLEIGKALVEGIKKGVKEEFPKLFKILKFFGEHPQFLTFPPMPTSGYVPSPEQKKLEDWRKKAEKVQRKINLNRPVMPTVIDIFATAREKIASLYAAAQKPQGPSIKPLPSPQEYFFKSMDDALKRSDKNEQKMISLLEQIVNRPVGSVGLE